MKTMKTKTDKMNKNTEFLNMIKCKKKSCKIDMVKKDDIF